MIESKTYRSSQVDIIYKDRTLENFKNGYLIIHSRRPLRGCSVINGIIYDRRHSTI